MSDDIRAVRAIALSEAVKAAAIDQDITNVLPRAAAYLDFLNGADAVPAVAPSAASSAPTAAKAKTTAKPISGATTKVTPAASASPSKPSSEPTPITKEQVGVAVEKMLAANKRAEAVALMKSLNATSVSSLSEDSYAAFLAGADEILMTA